MRSHGQDGENERASRDTEGGPLAGFASRAPRHLYEQLLLLIGRHPCLSATQLASLIGASAGRIRRIQIQLIQDGLLRRIGIDELPDRTSAIGLEEFSRLNLMEITRAGRRTLMGWLGLNSDAALRYHGVFGNGRGSAGRRRRLLRTLRHTIGVNSVFVALAVAAANAVDAGGTDYLVEWRSAVACERRQCKPDGYGCYRRDGRSYGFFLEYCERRRKNGPDVGIKAGQ